MYHRLIQGTEQPKRNPTTGANLGIVNREVTVWDIRNLFEGLSDAFGALDTDDTRLPINLAV